jgi:hypothetical protein
MSSLGRLLKILAVEHDTAVLITNYVVSGGRFGPGESKPALGLSWTYTSNIQLFFTIRASDPPTSKRQVECRKSSRVRFFFFFFSFFFFLILENILDDQSASH